MRYPAGSVSLQFRDKGILHLVADARYITHSQLFQLARVKAFEFDRRNFNWRVRRLANGGLLRKHVVPYLGTKDVLYSMTHGGIQALEQMGVRFLGGGYNKHDTELKEGVISHALEINRIRLALERSHIVGSWIPESLIRVLNLSSMWAYAKVYDAIVRINLGDGMSKELAIEYERTLKTNDRYEKIVEAIENEKRLDTILYLSPSYEITSTLRRHFQGVRHQILFAQVNDFLKDVLDTRVEFANTYSTATLRETLVRTSPESNRLP